MKKCRVCGNTFFAEPLICYQNMPKAVQFLPDATSVVSDKGIDFEVCQCSGCGLVQLSGEPVPYYREVVRAIAFSEEMKDFRIKQFENFVQKYMLKGKKIVEIGCGKGEYLSIMNQAGADVYGLEQSEESVLVCQENGLKVEQGFVENSTYRLSDALFSGFFMLNFLEHLPDPNAVMRGIYTNLTDNGIGLVEVPNFDMILRKNIFSEFTTDHLCYFTKETLRTLLMNNGFEVIESTEIWHDYIISAVVKKRGKLNIAHFQHYQEKIIGEIEKYMSQYKDKHVAIWGAGHQALAILSLINDTNKIGYVIDSAVFKQEKYTPATHIPIVAPDMLTSNPVQAVIVMAASYSDEVVRIIRKKFDSNIKVTVLRDFGLEES